MHRALPGGEGGQRPTRRRRAGRCSRRPPQRPSDPARCCALFLAQAGDCRCVGVPLGCAVTRTARLSKHAILVLPKNVRWSVRAAGGRVLHMEYKDGVKIVSGPVYRVALHSSRRCEKKRATGTFFTFFQHPSLPHNGLCAIRQPRPCTPSRGSVPVHVVSASRAWRFAARDSVALLLQRVCRRGTPRQDLRPGL